MRHTTNAPAANSDLAWLRETMANTRPDNIAEPERGKGLADYSWRYSMAVHTDVNYGHPACATSPGICTGHFTQIPAVYGSLFPPAFHQIKRTSDGRCATDLPPVTGVHCTTVSGSSLSSL